MDETLGSFSKKIIQRNNSIQYLLYAMALVFLVVWAVNHFLYNAGAIIHLSLLNACTCAFLGAIFKHRIINEHII